MQGSSVESVTASVGATSIKGTVQDSDTREPVRGALLRLQCDCLEGQRELQADANGEFVFRDLPPGAYEVQVLYEVAESLISVEVRADQTAELRFLLSNDPQVVT